MKKEITVQDVADMIDHSLLRPDITIDELKEGCDLAIKYNLISVCARPSDMDVVCEKLKGSSVLPTTVISFPHGTCTTETKIFELKDAISKGALECDVVMNVGRFLSGEYDYVVNELTKLAEISHENNIILKVIFENHYLTDEQIVKACQLAKEANVDFIKTSTGYAASGAKMHDLEIMVANAEGRQVKAAGGVRTLDDCLAMLAIGVTRVGTRASEDIILEAQKRFENGTLNVDQ
ncbi:MAG: deoxyribose-phosphate aldolase [Saccharofermentanales bacterium]|jgi:deoxyribose-phosphate aldolase